MASFVSSVQRDRVHFLCTLHYFYHKYLVHFERIQSVLHKIQKLFKAEALKCPHFHFFRLFPLLRLPPFSAFSVFFKNFLMSAKCTPFNVFFLIFSYRMGVEKAQRAPILLLFPHYSSVLKDHKLIAQIRETGKEISRKLLRIQKFVSHKSFSELYLVYKNVRLKFLRPILENVGKCKLSSLEQNYWILFIRRLLIISRTYSVRKKCTLFCAYEHYSTCVKISYDNCIQKIDDFYLKSKKFFNQIILASSTEFGAKELVQI